ncbi:MAG: hypothetical protein JW822_12260 [Spirochaetales bacterium]|nr:hypothetical protein [Spirochaetales bacterium]
MLDRITVNTIILFLIILLMSCVSHNSIRDDIEAEVIKCIDANEITLGEFILSNNTWNKGNVRNYDQCIFQMQKHSVFPFGWKWDWPLDEYQVRAYPEIIYGWKPWSSRSTTKTLPVRISEMKEIIATYEIQMSVDGRYNLAFDIWLNRSSRPGGNNISRELMIWLDRNAMIPAGSLMGNVMIAGEWYEFFIGNASHAAWTYIAFVKINPELKGDTKIHEFVNYLVKNNHISAQEYIACIEFGNEIISGSGETVIKQYAISVK